MNFENQGDEENKGKSSNFKSILIFVVAPALIAGFFSIAPKLYDELTRPVTKLSYSLIVGPTLETNGTYRRIFSVSILNAGKTILNNVSAGLHLTKGQIETATPERNDLKAELIANKTDAQLNISRMLPDEKLTVSMMAVSNAGPPVLDVGLRSAEVLGTLVETARDSKTENRLLAYGAILSGMSVALMSGGLLISVRSLLRSPSRSGLVSVLFNRPRRKSDLITLIIGMSQAFPVPDDILLREHDVTYARTADTFLIHGLAGNAAKRRRCILGLWSLLLIEGISDDSIAIVRQNLSHLGVGLTNPEFDALRKRANSFSYAQLRQEIMNLFAEASGEEPVSSEYSLN
ncbi:hypothetical protein [Methylocystis hirsuta]|uniref:Uncharacterized protein n=1 Tax=Methylocystis hirsuta TaxID=369798 RepID=A0A3M9XQW1_9HYPH|nr:hypothetical protein [Methylocystis hirsuta]RNJ49488.1 hypothetical protein D1O30_07615 [Methylocystis hirsuta]